MGENQCHIDASMADLLQVNGENYSVEEACRELERVLKENQILKATNEAYSVAEKSENDVWQIALKDMSAQLQVTASERAACQAALLKLQEYVPGSICVVQAVASIVRPGRLVMLLRIALGAVQ